MTGFDENSEIQLHHFDLNNFLNNDIGDIKRFMEGGNYPKFSVKRGKRDGIFSMEVPPFPEASSVIELLQAELPEELQALDLRFKRMDIFVRFVPKLEVEKVGGEKVSVIANYMDVFDLNKRKLWIQLSTERFKEMPKDDRIVNIVAAVVHEIAEKDYYLKTPNAPKDSDLLLGTKQYAFTEDEEIANRRALRVLKRRYPNVNLGDVQYPIDKDL